MQYIKSNLKKNAQSFVIFNLQYSTNGLWETLRHVYDTEPLACHTRGCRLTRKLLSAIMGRTSEDYGHIFSVTSLCVTSMYW